jgi:Glyoxalase-like domain
LPLVRGPAIVGESRVGTMNAPHLDHVGLTATTSTMQRLGFRVTPTQGMSSHARVFLDRSYIEVTPPSGDADGLGAGGWFLRAGDLEQAAAALRAHGIPTTGPSPYSGEDGTWLDVAVPSAFSQVLPILTRRVDVPAAVWPPPLEALHPNGATGLSEIHVRTAHPGTLASVLTAVGARAVGSGRFELAGGAMILVEDSPSGSEGFTVVVIGRGHGRPIRLEISN